MKTEARIGIFVIIALIVFGFFLIKIDKIKIGKKGAETFDIHAYFSNIAGLSSNATVRQQGFVIGKVKSIGLYEGRVKVIMSIRKDVELFTDSRASIRTVGLLGEKYVEIIRGPAKGKELTNNSEIKTADAGGVDAVVNVLNDIGDDLKQITASLRKSIGTQEGNERIERILNNIERFTADLKEMSQQNKQNINETLDAVRNITTDLEPKVPGISDDLKELLSELKNIAKENRANIKDSIENIEKLSDKLEKIVDKVKKGEGTVGKLMNESTLHDNANKVIKNIEDKMENASVILQQASYFAFSLGFRSEFYSEETELKNYISFKLRTWENMYFFAEIVDDNLSRVYDPAYNPDQDQIIFDRDLTFTLHSAVEFEDLVFRGGLTENKFGGAVDWFTFDDDLRVTVEGWDMGREIGPHLKLSFNYRFFKRFYFNLGFDDPVDTDRSQVFMGIGYSWLY